MKSKTTLLTKALTLLFVALFSFTARAQQSLPYYEDFDGEEIGPWSLANTADGTNLTSGKGEGYCFAFHWNTNPPQYLISPEFDGASAMTVSFDYAIESSSFPETFQVGYSTTTNDVSAFKWSKEVTATNIYNSEWLPYEENFPPGTKFVAIRYNSNDMYYLYLDNFSFEAYFGIMNPAGLAASHVTATSANISWDGNADSYNVRFSELGLYENFENGFGNWTIYTEGEHIDGYSGWVTMETGDSHAACAFSWYNYSSFAADNWLISPAVDLQGTLTYLAYSGYGDKYEVLLSTTGTDIEDFTIELKAMAAAPEEWTEETIDLSDYKGQGYIAFHHVSENCFYLGIDDIKITTEDWTTNSTTGTSTVLTGLNPETAYDVQVQAVYADGVSDWASTTFITPSETDAPIDLIASDITATQATLSWTGSQDSFNVQYRTAAIYDVIWEDDFENGLDQWTIGGTGEAVESNALWYTMNPTSGLGFESHSGTYCASSWSWNSSAYNAENWLVTPQLNLGGVLRFFVRTNSGYPDSYEVLLSTTGNAINTYDNNGDYVSGDFTTTLQAMNPAPAVNEWNEVVIDLSAYNNQQGYIAIHHVDYDMNYLVIDDFGIYNFTPAGEWVSATVTEETLALTDLTPNTKYEWQVLGNLKEGTTEWSEMSSFTTLETPASVTIGATGYATYVAPSDVSFPSDVTAFIITATTGTSVTMEAVEAVPAGTAVVVKGDAGTYYLTAATSTDDVTSNLLQACTAAFNPTAENTIYCLANKSKGVGFYPVATSVTIPAGKAYLEIPSGEAKAFYGFFEDDATDIRDLKSLKDSKDIIFNLAGQRLNKAQKGINIINGKKVLK